jgi:dihydrofolate reductase
MRRIAAVESITMDGVMQAPGGAGEDTRGGFRHGGWARPYMDHVMGEAMGGRMAAGGGPLLFGRRTYEQFASFWPHQADGNPFTPVLNAAQKYVASATLASDRELAWQNSALIGGDVPAAVRALKEQDGKDLGVLGSGQLVRSLLDHGLIDELVLMIHPLVLGAGTRLFGDHGRSYRLELVSTITTTTGVIIATMRPSEGIR